MSGGARAQGEARHRRAVVARRQRGAPGAPPQVRGTADPGMAGPWIPVALVPGASGRYRMIDPETGHPQRVDAGLARDLDPEAYFFYRALPRDEAIRTGPVFRFAFHGLGSDLARFTLAGLLAGFLMLSPAVLLGVLVDHVIPSGSGRKLLELSLCLILLAVLTGLLKVLQGTALMRLEALAAARLGAALWDRMLDLPQRFFRRLLLRRSGHARHGLPGAARPSLGRGRQRGAVGDLPPADVRPAVPLRHQDRLAGPGAGGLLPRADHGHRHPPASPPPAPARDLAASGRQAPAVAQRHRQAPVDRVGRHRVRHVGEGLPGAEADRDTARQAGRAPVRLPRRRPPAGGGGGVHGGDGGRPRDPSDRGLPHRLHGPDGVPRGDRRARRLVLRRRRHRARL